MAPRAAVVLAAAGLLAGCLTGDRSEGPAAPTGPNVLPWTLRDCQFAIALVAVASTRLPAERLPEGFRYLRPGEAGLPPDPRGDAFLGVEAWRCAEATGLATLKDPPYASFYSVVEPPEELRDANVSVHFLKWETVVADPGLRARLHDAGLPVLSGDVEFAQFATSPVGALTFDGVGRFDGVGEFPMRGTASAPAEDFQSFDFVEWTPTREGLAAWRAHANFSTIVTGAGTLAMPPGSFPREVVGRDTTDAFYFAGVGSFENGTITLDVRRTEAP